MRIKTGKNETEGKESDSVQESKTQAMNHVATASVVEQLSAVAANKMFKTFLNPSPAVLLLITNTTETDRNAAEVAFFRFQVKVV